MSAQPFVIERTFNAPVAKVWDAISNRDQMKLWYFDLAEFKPEVGFEFTFNGGTETKTYKHLCVVTRAAPNEVLAYSWRYDGYEGNSEVVFELQADGDKTHLKLTHSGIETFGLEPDFDKSNFAMGWTSLIGESLKGFLEKA